MNDNEYANNNNNNKRQPLETGKRKQHQIHWLKLKTYLETNDYNPASTPYHPNPL